MAKPGSKKKKETKGIKYRHTGRKEGKEGGKEREEVRERGKFEV